MARPSSRSAAGLTGNSLCQLSKPATWPLDQLAPGESVSLTRGGMPGPMRRFERSRDSATRTERNRWKAASTSFAVVSSLARFTPWVMRGSTEPYRKNGARASRRRLSARCRSSTDLLLRTSVMSSLAKSTRYCTSNRRNWMMATQASEAPTPQWLGMARRGAAGLSFGLRVTRLNTWWSA